MMPTEKEDFDVTPLTFFTNILALSSVYTVDSKTAKTAKTAPLIN